MPFAYTETECTATSTSSTNAFFPMLFECLPNEFAPSPTDVVFGQDPALRDHVGNQRMYKMMKEKIKEYKEALEADDRSSRDAIIHNIMDNVRAGHGEFVLRNIANGRWYKLVDDLTRQHLDRSFRKVLDRAYGSSDIVTHDSNATSTTNAAPTTATTTTTTAPYPYAPSLFHPSDQRRGGGGGGGLHEPDRPQHYSMHIPYPPMGAVYPNNGFYWHAGYQHPPLPLPWTQPNPVTNKHAKQRGKLPAQGFKPNEQYHRPPVSLQNSKSTTTTNQTASAQLYHSSNAESIPRTYRNPLTYEGKPRGKLRKRPWPEDWKERCYKRTMGISMGREDFYYYPPGTKYRLRSLAEVNRYLDALEETGDVKVAYERSKPPPKEDDCIKGPAETDDMQIPDVTVSLARYLEYREAEDQCFSHVASATTPLAEQAQATEKENNCGLSSPQVERSTNNANIVIDVDADDQIECLFRNTASEPKRNNSLPLQSIRPVETLSQSEDYDTQLKFLFNTPDDNIPEEIDSSDMARNYPNNIGDKFDTRHEGTRRLSLSEDYCEPSSKRHNSPSLGSSSSSTRLNEQQSFAEQPDGDCASTDGTDEVVFVGVSLAPIAPTSSSWFDTNAQSNME